MITIVDYGMGNLKSIQNMLKKAGMNSEITSDVSKIEQAVKIILPGVGSFDNAMNNIHELGFYNLLNKKVLEEKVPILGICLGMQIMCKQSEEGTVKGFSWIDADVKRFVFDNKNLKVPHMGWNTVYTKDYSCLFDGFKDAVMRFYHVHSYYVKLNQQEDELSYTHYGFDFTSSFRKNNVFGVQFHPEKSHKFGFSLLKKFAEL